MTTNDVTTTTRTTLTQKQRDFCIYIVQGLSGTKAAEKAGYSLVTASAIGSENLQKPLIKSYIEEIRSNIDSPKILNITQRQEILSDIANNNTSKARESTKIQAINELNKMDGAHAPVKQAFLGHITFDIEYKKKLPKGDSDGDTTTNDSNT